LTLCEECHNNYEERGAEHVALELLIIQVHELFHDANGVMCFVEWLGELKQEIPESFPSFIRAATIYFGTPSFAQMVRECIERGPASFRDAEWIKELTERANEARHD
jgi:hypothetical protein